MDIENGLNKILTPVEKYSSLLGAGIALVPQISQIQDSVYQMLSGNIHAPEWNNIKDTMLAWDPTVKTAALTAIAGYFVKDATNNSALRKIGQIAQYGGLAYIIAKLASVAFYYSTHSPTVSPQPNPGVFGNGANTRAPQQGNNGNAFLSVYA